MEIIDKKKVYEGRFIRVSDWRYKTPSGKEGTWQVVERPNSKKIVIVFAMTPEREVILTKIFRIPLNSWVIENSAGLTDKEGESYEDAARRELREETGYRAGRMIKVLDGPFNAGMSTDQAIVFFAPDAVYEGAPELEAGEEGMTAIKVPLDSLVDFITDPPEGTLVDIKILAALPILQKKKLL